MEPFFILDHPQQDALLHALESGTRLATLRQFAQWSQSELQALLPHQVLACLRFGGGDELLRLECLYGVQPAPHALGALADPRAGLALRIARHCLQGARVPALADGVAPADGVLEAFAAESRELGWHRFLVHGSGRMEEGMSVFILFGLPPHAGPRHAYCLELLLPVLHLALARLAPARAPGPNTPVRALSRREVEIVGWLREGKSNDEIGQLLGISGLTIKNHLQRIYRALGVSNRAHALARCLEFRLLDQAPRHV